MKSLGKFSHISNKGNIILRSPNTPSMGAFVFTKDKKRIGKVNRIFGPTKNAYISIRPNQSINLNPGDDLYLSSRYSKKKSAKKFSKKFSNKRGR